MKPFIDLRLLSIVCKANTSDKLNQAPSPRTVYKTGSMTGTSYIAPEYWSAAINNLWSVSEGRHPMSKAPKPNPYIQVMERQKEHDGLDGHMRLVTTADSEN